MASIFLSRVRLHCAVYFMTSSPDPRLDHTQGLWRPCVDSGHFYSLNWLWSSRRGLLCCYLHPSGTFRSGSRELCLNRKIDKIASGGGGRCQNKKKTSYLHWAWICIKADVVNLHVNVLTLYGQCWAEYINNMKIRRSGLSLELVWQPCFGFVCFCHVCCFFVLCERCGYWAVTPSHSETGSEHGCSTYMIF